MGKPGQQPAATKPIISKCAATSTTKSCNCTSCSGSTCTHTSSYCSTCTFFFYFIGGVGQDDDPSKYTIPAGD